MPAGPRPGDASAMTNENSTRLPRALSVLAAPVAAMAVWTIAVPVAGVHAIVKTNGETQQVGVAAVIGAAVLAGLAAWALLAILERGNDKPRATWTVIAAVALGISLVGPLGSGGHLTTVITLLCMHLAVGAVLIPSLRHTARAPQR